MKKQKILLIEDDQMIREIYTYTLEKVGFNVLTAEDGEEGIKLVKNNFDAKLILLDVIMPNMNGIEVFKRLKGDLAIHKIPVVLLSNLTDDDIIDKAMDLGIYGYLVKAQFSPYQLVDKVKEILAFYENNQG